MADSRIVDYIDQCRQNGIDLDTIKQNLLSAGWASDDVNEAINMVQPYEEIGPAALESLKHPKKKFSKLFLIPLVLIVVVIVFAVVQPTGEKVCEEEWECSTWARCIDGIQKRECIDMQHCGTEVFKPTDSQSCTMPESQTDNTTTLLETKGPKEVYLDYKNEFDNTGSFNEYVDVVMKYGSQKRIGEIEAQKEEFNIAEEAMVLLMFNFMKSVSPTASQITNITEQIDGDSATLLIDLEDASTKGNITMVRENGVWKVELDHWSQKIV